MTLRYFNAAEFACKCGCGTNVVKDDLLVVLDEARHLAGFPFVVTSGSRCERNNRRHRGMADSAHLTGWAADLKADHSTQRWAIVQAAIRAGFKRIGIGQTFVHLDCDPTKPAGVIWLYS